MNKPRMWWSGDENGWMIDTEVALTNSEMLRSIEFTLMVQQDRNKGLLPGPLKDECLRTIEALKTGKVTQNLVGKGEKVLYDAYKSTGKKVFA